MAEVLRTSVESSRVLYLHLLGQDMVRAEQIHCLATERCILWCLHLLLLDLEAGMTYGTVG